MGWRKQTKWGPRFTPSETMLRNRFGFRKKLQTVTTKSSGTRKIKVSGNKLGDYLSEKTIEGINSFLSGKEKLEIR